MSDVTTFASRALVPAMVAVCLALARRYLKPSVRLPENRLSELDGRFQFTKWLVGAGMIAAGAAFAWGTHQIFVCLNRYLAAGDASGASLQLWPQSAIWWFFPGFGALTLCWEITLQIWSAFDRGDSARLYRLWSDGRLGFDCPRILRWAALVIAAPIGVLTILALPMHTTLRDQDIRQCGYAWAKCQTFDYSKAVKMTQIEGFRLRDGSLSSRAGIVVDFANGRRWSSTDTGDFHDSLDPALLAFLTERIRLPLEQAETGADIPKAITKNSQSPGRSAGTAQ